MELNVAASAIPESLEADISALEIGDNVKISDIALPDGATPTISDRDFTIATVAGRTAEIEPEVVEGEEGAEGEEGTEGGEAEGDAE